MALNDHLISDQAKIWWQSEMRILADRKKRERERTQRHPLKHRVGDAYKNSPPKEKSSN